MIEASAGIVSAGEPSPPPEDVLDEHEMHAIDEEKLEALGRSLSDRRDEWATARKASGVEKRWMEDLDQYHGRDAITKQVASMMDSAEQGYPVTNRDSKPQRSTVYVNITRPKTNAAEARVASIWLPSDDRNWGFKPSPNPELVKSAIEEAKATMIATDQPPAPQPNPAQPPDSAQDPSAPPAPPQPAPQPPQGSIVGPATPKKTAVAQMQEADERCKAMQDTVDDQLIDCQYNGEARKMLHHCATLGTGVFKGPIVVNRTRKAWSPMKGSSDKSVYTLEIIEEKTPASESVNPWNVFPDPSCNGDVHSGRGIFEYGTVNGKQLRELCKQPGYLEHQIAKVLEQGPDDSPYISDHDQRERDDNGVRAADKEHYQLWEYWGEFSPEDLRAANVNIPEDSTESLSGCVIFVNDIVIKGFLNPIETGDIPYDFVQWELVDGSPWGYGVPYLMRPAQRVLNAAWRQLMDNSGLSVGPQVLIKRRGITPADGRHEITGRKVWLLDDDVNPKDAMATFDIPNYGQEIQQIIDLAMKFADEEASIPALAQGEKGNAPDTVGGMTILMNSSNVVLGRMVKQLDDCITRPHLRRYYDWNMAYSDKENIKGDFQVDARGSSALLVRDIQAQALLQLGQFQASPIISSYVNWEEWFRQVLKLQHLDPTDIMKTDAEIAKTQSAPQQPPIQLQVAQAKAQSDAQLAQMKFQNEMQMAAADAQHDQNQLQAGAATPHMAAAQAKIIDARIKAESAERVQTARAQAEEARAQKDLEIATQNGQFKLQELQIQREIAMLNYSTQQKISLDDAKMQLAKSAMDNQTKKQLSEAEIELARDQHGANTAVDLHKHNTSLVRDMMSTPNTP